MEIWIWKCFLSDVALGKKPLNMGSENIIFLEMIVIEMCCE